MTVLLTFILASQLYAVRSMIIDPSELNKPPEQVIEEPTGVSHQESLPPSSEGFQAVLEKGCPSRYSGTIGSTPKLPFCLFYTSSHLSVI